MKIAVCIKRVADTAAKIRIGGDGNTIDPSDVQYIISSFDEFAIEEAIRLKEKSGEGSVTVFCLGPKGATQNVRQALAMGADSGVLLTHEGPPLDAYQTSRNLAASIQAGNFDMVIFGRASVDDQSGQVGPMTARMLGIPCVTDVVAVEVNDGVARAEREIEGAREVIEASLPVALTAQKGLNEPRYASLKGIMAAKKKPIEETPSSEQPARLRTVSLALPAERPSGKIVGEGVDCVPELVRLLREEAKVI